MRGLVPLEGGARSGYPFDMKRVAPVVVGASVVALSTIACGKILDEDLVGTRIKDAGPNEAAARDGSRGTDAGSDAEAFDASASDHASESSDGSISGEGAAADREGGDARGADAPADSPKDSPKDSPEASPADGGDAAMESDAWVCPEGIESGPPEPASCAPGGAGMTNCGPGGSGCESCCTSLEVEGGTFYRTYENDGGGPWNEADPATLSTFRLDKYLVTVGRFRQFVVAWNGGSGYLPPAGSGKHAYLNEGKGLENSESPGTYETGWDAADWDPYVAPVTPQLSCDPNGRESLDTWTDARGSHESLPVNCVNWYEAYAFCIWDGGFLPSEAEWEYAAAGGSQQRQYPWGSTVPGVRPQESSLYAIYAANYLVASRGSTYPAPVGYAYLGAGYWGQLDLEGQVLERTADCLAPYTACTNCAAMTNSTARIAKGGDFTNGIWDLFVGLNWYALGIGDVEDDPASGNLGRGWNVGFRCARAP
jgi:formylglycine-generating enzyme required for sulfatase activity